MKLVRFGPPGLEKPGMIDAHGRVRDLSVLVPDFTPQWLSPTSLEALRAIDISKLPLAPPSSRLGAPWTGIGKFIAIGLNYHDHAAEANMPVPDSPVIFAKWTSCVCGPHDDTLRPPESEKIDWEVELGIVIGQAARNVDVENALEYAAGFCLCDDVSERAYQIALSGGQWGKGKGFDTFGPIGPWLATADEISDPQNLDMWLDVNGERKQTGNTAKMIFSCAELISYCSRVMTLEPGDIIATGTPPGVGMGFSPPQYLQDGDTVTLGISGLGMQRHVVVSSTPGTTKKPTTQIEGSSSMPVVSWTLATGWL